MATKSKTKSPKTTLTKPTRAAQAALKRAATRVINESPHTDELLDQLAQEAMLIAGSEDDNGNPPDYRAYIESALKIAFENVPRKAKAEVLDPHYIERFVKYGMC